MVTTIPDRHDFAVQSVKDFTAQHWPHKDLVIVNSTHLPFPKLENVFEIPARNAESLWEMGVAQSKGEWIADWQDDCRYSPTYLHALARLRSREKRVSLMGYKGVCLDSGQEVNVDNDGTAFSLVFRFSPKVNGALTWLDRRELVTRYYAAKA